MSEPQMLRVTLFNCQVCVPAAWSDGEAEAFAERAAPCGTTHGWRVRTDHEDPTRVPCQERADCVHIVMNA